MPTAQDGTSLSAWRPGITGVREILHARFTKHAYPMHVHDEWTLLIVDDGQISFDVDKRHEGAGRATVTLLPPGVPHNGSAASDAGFCKRVAYLDTTLLPATLAGRAATHPVFADARLAGQLAAFHVAVRNNRLEAESRLALVIAALHRLLGRPLAQERVARRTLAHDLRDLLDDHLTDGVDLAAAAAALHAHPAHLVRAFGRQFGIAPHQYLISRRVNAARRLLLTGRPAAEVAPEVGFYDQAHFTRTFKRILGTTPAAYSRSGALRPPRPDWRDTSPRTRSGRPGVRG